MQIRPATIHDGMSVRKMMLDLAEYEHRISDLKTSDFRTIQFIDRHLKEWLTEKKYLFFVAEHEGKSVGYIFGWKEYVSEAYRNAEVGYICDCYVIPEARGLKVGKLLTEELIAAFRRLGLREAKLLVLSKSQESVRVWEAMGFNEEYKEMRKLI